MKPTLALLAATAVGALVTISVAGAIQPLFKDVPRPAAAIADDGTSAVARADDRRAHKERKRRHSDDDDDDDDDDRCDDDERAYDDRSGTLGTAPAPAPARSATPPANSLFGSGAPPRVQVN